MADRQARNGFVYFIEIDGGEFIKIGFSTRIIRRLSDLGTLRPSGFKLRLLGAIPGTMATDRWLHERFAQYRDAGEWFRDCPEIRAFVTAATGVGPTERGGVSREVDVGVVDTPRDSGDERPAPDFLTEGQIARLFEVIGDNARDQAIFRLMYHRALRGSEIGMLQLSDWNPGAGSLFVRRVKGSISARYSLLQVEQRVLKAWVRVRGKAMGAMFPSREGVPICRNQLFFLFFRYCETAGIPKHLAHPHVLKHSCGMHLMARLKNIRAVKDWMGHASVRSTMVYVPKGMSPDLPAARDEAAAAVYGWGTITGAKRKTSEPDQQQFDPEMRDLCSRLDGRSDL